MDELTSFLIPSLLTVSNQLEKKKIACESPVCKFCLIQIRQFRDELRDTEKRY